jgi:hypothetical protein
VVIVKLKLGWSTIPNTQGFWFALHSAVAGLSESANFTTPPAVGASSVRAVIYGDMGQAERDNASIHYEEVCTWLSKNLGSLCQVRLQCGFDEGVSCLQPGSITVVDALTNRSDYDVVLHIGDISYATGFLVEWDSFLELVAPVASKVPYMTAIGNHER